MSSQPADQHEAWPVTRFTGSLGHASLFGPGAPKTLLRKHGSALIYTASGIVLYLRRY
jgi:hypothetical protein